ncbi:redoxin domain-containing protein [Gimibacter soli]|uniref:Redoxin domain-containing protein n=1 Tax=Gimibacter soli TaxID=3024400 RepID=A0AAF0BKV9_9PROT|nr:redoxin domain-containing protein [Gimibacter soli]WCL53402.1 redoxin domain-containing protein [Gimibacter soli]
MTTALVVSQILLWALVISMSLVIVALARQVGVLHERLAPAGALAMNRKLKVGDKAPQAPVTDLNGRSSMLEPASNGRSELLFFLSPDCPVCKTLLPALHSFRKNERKWLDVSIASDGEAAPHQAFAQSENLDFAKYYLSEELGKAFGVSKLPYAVLIDEKGTIAAMGLVNSREHLESLVNARTMGVASIQDYMRDRASA